MPNSFFKNLFQLKKVSVTSKLMGVWGRGEGRQTCYGLVAPPFSSSPLKSGIVLMMNGPSDSPVSLPILSVNAERAFLKQSYKR